MKVTMYHMQGKPVELEDRKAAAKEWQEYANEVLLIKPEQEDTSAWQAINDKLDVKEAELKAKYPIKKQLFLKGIADIKKIIDKYGALSICQEPEGFALYIGDV